MDKIAVALKLSGRFLIGKNESPIGLIANADDQNRYQTEEEEPLQPGSPRISGADAIEQQNDGKDREKSNENTQPVITADPRHEKQREQETATAQGSKQNRSEIHLGE